MIIQGEVAVVVVAQACDSGGAGGLDEEELLDTIIALEIAHYAEVTTTTYWPAILLVCRLSCSYNTHSQYRL